MFELDAGPVAGQGLYSRRGSGVPMANLGRETARLRRWIAHPIHTGRGQLRAPECFLGSDNDALLGGMKGQDIAGLSRSARRDTKPLALPDGESVDAAVSSQNVTVPVRDDAARRL